MLIIPEHEGESVREFGQRLRLWNPQLDLNDLRTIYAGSPLQEPGDIILTVEPYCGIDRRNDWNTHIVRVNGSAIGFTDGMPSEA